MKKSSIITVLAAAVVIVSCGGKNSPGVAYMPDMMNSRAYETYADHSNLAEKNINYTSVPVPGTISREEEMPFHIAKDQGTDSSHYVASRAVPNPIDSLSETDTKEAERLYMINCGICHGAKMDGNGPLYNGGSGPYPAAPKNLIGDATVSAMPDGQMFYSVTYGKNLMGSYASQMSRKQRWMVIKYIKTKQAEAKAKTAPAATVAAPAAATAK
ncbi:c-type cytochrome [Sediminibacterium soli]|uniref:c-type cytochrome n=1 Tax=Sediminibacterium soli TaxID=2698829 RepID=UPI00137ADD28|nr:cytochrome c [Sediminibacterium soli]NCI45278.1 cytochrome c [Sediminibacterium soli]